MAEIVIQYNKKWKDEEQLVKRIARVVCHDDSMCQARDTSHGGYKWCLHIGGNDWFAELQGENQIKVAYRYGGGGNAPMMEALKTLLEWTLG